MKVGIMHSDVLITGVALLNQTSILIGAGLLVLFAFYGWLALRSSARAVLTTKPFGLPDAIWGGILALGMIFSLLCSIRSPIQLITFPDLLMNSVLYGALVLGIIGVIGFQRHSAISIFQLQPSRFPKAAATGLLWLLITSPLIAAIQYAVQHFSGDTDDTQLIIRYFVEHPDLKNRILVIFMVLVVAPIAEEIIFRGYFYGIIRRYCGRIPALLTSSLLFTAIHGNLAAAPGLFFLAITLCLLYERTGTLWASMTLHAAFNTSTIIALILAPGAA